MPSEMGFKPVDVERIIEQRFILKPEDETALAGDVFEWEEAEGNKVSAEQQELVRLFKFFHSLPRPETKQS